MACATVCAGAVNVPPGPAPKPANSKPVPEFAVPPSGDASKWTHINHTFALVDEATCQIAQMNNLLIEHYPQDQYQKEKISRHEILSGICGWDAGGAFSEKVSSPANRAAIVQ
ncbi:hypothetical protein G3M48_003108 [Beauveria asiatica]|uniref:Uncharacterized protein n=1 Tax=Beauveria asiatica TaxID=1069075 RepID=A0AAW0RVV0_9HYPO